MQGIHAQALRLQMVLNRQNTMYYDVLNTLQLRKEAAAAIETDITNLKTKSQNPPAPTTTSSRTKVAVKASAATSKATAAAEKAAAAAAVALQKQKMEVETSEESSVLRVQLLTSDREVIFYKVWHFLTHPLHHSFTPPIPPPP